MHVELHKHLHQYCPQTATLHDFKTFTCLLPPVCVSLRQKENCHLQASDAKGARLAVKVLKYVFESAGLLC